MTGNFIRSCANQAGVLAAPEFSALAVHCADLLTSALASLQPCAGAKSWSRSALLLRIKDFVERNLCDPSMDVAMVASSVGLSSRYINDLFKDEQTSLMRYVLRRRLEHCGRDLRAQTRNGRRISDIAFGWGFNDMSHFSRAFKQSFGDSPREYKQRAEAIEAKPARPVGRTDSA